MMNSTLIRIGELARQAQVSIDTIRFYERLKLIRAFQRSESGYRYYVPADVSRLRFIRSAKCLGFSLEEIGQLLEVEADDGGSCREVDVLVHRKVSMLEERIARLRSARNALRKVLQHDDTPGGTQTRGTVERLRRLIEDAGVELDQEDVSGFSRRPSGRPTHPDCDVREKGDD